MGIRDLIDALCPYGYRKISVKAATGPLFVEFGPLNVVIVNVPSFERLGVIMGLMIKPIFWMQALTAPIPWSGMHLKALWTQDRECENRHYFRCLG